MAVLRVQCLLLFMFMYGTFGDLSLIENEVSDKNGLLPSTISGKASNVLRDILNQESLVRFSMVQKIQSLVMDATNSKSDIQVIKAKLGEMAKDLWNLKTKNQILEEENIELKEKFKMVNGTVNVNTNFTKQEMQYIDQVVESKTLTLQEQFDLSKKTLERDLKKVIQTLKMTEQNTKEKIKALNESQMVSAKSPQIEMFQYQMNAMNVTLQKCSVSSFFERVKKTEYALENFSVSVNETLHTVCGDLNESSWILSKGLRGDFKETFPSLKGRDGLYRISVGSGIKSVYCDMSTDGGGWTAIQWRQDGSTDFYRTWTEYKQGFGDPSTNYWIGNDAIYELTKNKDQELRVELQRFNGDEAYAQYSTFYVGDKYHKYVLTVSGYSGTAGDSLNYHNGYKCTTKDQDNDRYSVGNCAVSYHGAWWYNDCALSNLNGLYGQSGVSGWKYTTWYHLKSNWETSKQTVMMIRHKN